MARCKQIMLTASVLAMLATPVALSGMLSTAFAGNALTAADTDADGTLDKAEVDKAAAVNFEKLDPDKDGQLDKKEVGKRLSKAAFAAADPDHDGLLSNDEYVAAADKYFAAADADHDGTVDAKELKSKPGRVLDRLIN
jgi:hypothetical protein